MLPVVCVGVVGVAVYAWSRSSKAVRANTTRFSRLDLISGFALENHDILSEFVDRLSQYSSFHPDAYNEFVVASSEAAEFMERRSEIKHARSIPMWFRGFTTEMVRSLKKLRQAVRDSEPHRLEQFDEIRNDVFTFQKETNKNLWWDAHPQ